jgi:predicted methyltransferase
MGIHHTLVLLATAAGTIATGACGDGGRSDATTPGAQLADARARSAPATELGAAEAPDRAVWQQPERVMDALNIADSSRVADVAARGGWFTAYLARRVGPNGVVYAADVQATMIDSITRKMKMEGLTNVQTILASPDDPHLPSGLHAALLVDAYPQLPDPVAMLRRTAAALVPGGRIGIVDFKNDGAGGPGPPLADRVAPEKVIKDAQQAGLTLSSHQRFLRYQFMLVFTRTGS